MMANQDRGGHVRLTEDEAAKLLTLANQIRFSRPRLAGAKGGRDFTVCWKNGQKQTVFFGPDFLSIEGRPFPFTRLEGGGELADYYDEVKASRNP